MRYTLILLALLCAAPAVAADSRRYSGADYGATRRYSGADYAPLWRFTDYPRGIPKAGERATGYTYYPYAPYRSYLLDSGYNRNKAQRYPVR